MKIGDKVRVKQSHIMNKINDLGVDYTENTQQEDYQIFTIIDIYGRSSRGFICTCKCGSLIKDYANCHLELI